MDERPGSRSWIWFFVVLSMLGCAALIIPLLYNRAQQLQPEQLQAARELWIDNGLGDYNLTYVMREDSEGLDSRVEQEITVKVRNGKIVAANRNGDKLENLGTSVLDVPGLFDLIDSYLEQDRHKEGRPNFAHAQFDPSDGHPIHFVHRVMGSQERLEIMMQLDRDLTEDTEEPPSRSP